MRLASERRLKLIAIVFGMASNFILNNEITYRSCRRRGLGLIDGFAGSALGCGRWEHAGDEAGGLPGLTPRAFEPFLGLATAPWV